MFVNFNRVLKFALFDFYRNQGRAVAAIFVLTLAIICVTGIFLLHGIGNQVILQIKNKIDITAYFKSGTDENDILTTKNTLLKSNLGIQNIQYVSSDDALERFTQAHQGNSIFFDALTQVGGNPFLPALNITTVSGDADQYKKIVDKLQGEPFVDLIDSVDFSQKKDTIDKVSAITKNINNFGLGLAILFVLVAILVVFNTIKLSIDASKDEISTMRIVGASSWFVRAPFVIQGAIFGGIAFVICLFATMLLSFLVSSSLSFVLSGFSLFGYVLSNLFIIMVMQFFIAVGLGVCASFVVVQKYLKV